MATNKFRGSVPVNNDFFNEVDSPAKAYLLGFIAADGNVYRGRLQISLDARDSEHLLAIRSLLGSRHAITPNRTMMAFSIRSVRLVAALERLGITPAKTFTVRPWCGPEELMPHYWRGVFDGDGSWYVGRDHGTVCGQAELTGNEFMCRGFLDFVRSRINTVAGCISPSKSVFRTRFKGVSLAKEVVRLLYPAGEYPQLDRKRQKAESILDIPERQNRNQLHRGN